jgi:hypothetical protein
VSGEEARGVVAGGHLDGAATRSWSAEPPASVFHLLRLAADCAVDGDRILIGPTLQDQPWVMDFTKQLGITFSLGAQGVEWGETPFWIDPLALVELALVAINFIKHSSQIADALALKIRQSTNKWQQF